MRPIKSFIAMVLLVSIFLIFVYSTLHLESTYGHRAELQTVYQSLATDKSEERIVKTPTPKLEIVTTTSSTTTTTITTTTPPQPQGPQVSISNKLRENIPQNSAYWNRLLYSALRKLEKGGNPAGRNSDWSRCRETSQESIQTNVHDIASYPMLFRDFVEGMVCRFPPLLINQRDKCKTDEQRGTNQTLFLFAIKSAPGNFQRRQAVRETWGREGTYENGLRVRTVFLLGSAGQDDPNLSALLSFEARHHEDILQWDFHESFLNLTLKMSTLLEWTVKHCPHVSYVFSGDDDVFVNTPALVGYLQSLEPSKASQLYVGHVIKTARPLRDPKSKYYIPLSYYDNAYPAYAGGGGFLFSGVWLQPLHLVSQVLPFFPIDDVYIGMCFQAIGVSAELHPGFQTFDVKEQDRDNVCVHKGLILTHQRTPQQLKRLWNGIHSPFLTC